MDWYMYRVANEGMIVGQIEEAGSGMTGGKSEGIWWTGMCKILTRECAKVHSMKYRKCVIYRDDNPEDALM